MCGMKEIKIVRILLQVIIILRRWGIVIVHGLRDRRSKFWCNVREDIKLAFLDLITFDPSQMTCDIGNQIVHVLFREFIALDRSVSTYYAVRKKSAYKLPWPVEVNRLVNFTEATNGSADPNGMITRVVGRLLELHRIHSGRIIWPLTLVRKCHKTVTLERGHRIQGTIDWELEGKRSITERGPRPRRYLLVVDTKPISMGVWI